MVEQVFERAIVATPEHVEKGLDLHVRPFIRVLSGVVVCRVVFLVASQHQSGIAAQFHVFVLVARQIEYDLSLSCPAFQ